MAYPFCFSGSSIVGIEMRSRFIPVLVLLALLASQPDTLSAEDRVNAAERKVPRQLLGLLHAPEVHTELGLSASQITELEKQFQVVDGRWFRARIEPPTANLLIMQELEESMNRWLSNHFSDVQRQRLKELELQAQGTRVLLRGDVADRLSFSEKQKSDLLRMASETDEAVTAYQQSLRQGKDDTTLKATVQEKQKSERDAIYTVLTESQRAELGELLGEKFHTAGLTRIYPMAPDFSPSADWLNSPALSLKQLRGKVVLVHFYAFQCHNCQANFDVYRRWHDRFGDDVVVVGIQTPETPDERRRDRVAAAVKLDDFKFPVIFDAASEHWKTWGNTMWPTVYVIDKKGYLRRWWQGELRWKGADTDQQLESLIEDLIEES